MDPTIDLLQMGLDGAMKRQKVISNNIANVDTPGYKRKEVDFLSVLKKKSAEGNKKAEKSKIKGPSRPESLSLARTNKHHIDSRKSSKTGFAVETSSDTKYRNDKNNVDIDHEMAEMAKTNLYYSTLSRRITGKFNKLETVIKKGGN